MFAIHGYPEQIVSDNGPQFTSEDWKKFCDEYGVKHILTPPHHPQSNGEAERFVRTFKEMVKKTEPKQSEIEEIIQLPEKLQLRSLSVEKYEHQ